MKRTLALFVWSLAVVLVTGSLKAQTGPGSALVFDGIDDFVKPSANPFGNVSNTFTMEAWVKPAAARNDTTEANAGISGTTAQRYAVCPDQGDTAYGAGHAGAG